MKNQWYYRGSLNFCNYSCSYCPFSKRTYQRSVLTKDEAQWNRFVSEFESDAAYEGAVLVTPYAEALLYDYYWKGLARLSRLPYIDYVGAQSNFSFSIEEKLSVYANAGGELRKLRLWLTYHPEMISPEDFAEKCKKLSEHQVAFSAGCVGIPGETERILKLRQLLPKSCYLWINKMDGAKRPYTRQEIETFEGIDPFFPLGLRVHSGKGRCCQAVGALRFYGRQERTESYFVDADGRVTGCNLCQNVLFSIYEKERTHVFEKKQGCSIKNCSCYLSYNNLHLSELVFFEPYPMFRIPDYKKALFFDIDGTLLFRGEKTLRSRVKSQLRYLAGHTRLYLATSLPVEVARQVLGTEWKLFSGGAFGNGGCLLTMDGFQKVSRMDGEIQCRIRAFAKKKGYPVYFYQWEGVTYKATMFARRKRMDVQELRNELKLPIDYQLLIEEDCIQVTGASTGKKEGVLTLISQLGLQKEEVMFFGDSENDEETMQALPFSCKVTHRI